MPVVYRVQQPVQRQWRVRFENGLHVIESRRRLGEVLREDRSVQLSDRDFWEVENYGTPVGVMRGRETVLVTNGGSYSYSTEGGRVVQGKNINSDAETRDYLYWSSSERKR